MFFLVIYTQVEHEGCSEPLALFGPFETEKVAQQFFTDTEKRLVRLYGSSYSDLSCEIFAPVPNLDFKDEVTENDEVRLEDPTSKFNTHLGTVKSLNKELNSAFVKFNRIEAIVPLDKLVIQYV